MKNRVRRVRCNAGSHQSWYHEVTYYNMPEKWPLVMYGMPWNELHSHVWHALERTSQSCMTCLRMNFTVMYGMPWIWNELQSCMACLGFGMNFTVTHSITTEWTSDLHLHVNIFCLFSTWLNIQRQMHNNSTTHTHHSLSFTPLSLSSQSPPSPFLSLSLWQPPFFSTEKKVYKANLL